jgi:uncharacterized iron-regulated membrane protein
MYRGTRQTHRWVGIVLSIFLVLIAVTGFFLALKAQVGWIRPPEVQAQEVESMAEVISIDAAIASAVGQGNPHITSYRDIDRVDFRPRRNIFKILSREGYIEMQVDGKTGEVLSVSKRNDQLIEDLHDLSWFHENFRTLILPAVAIGLLLLAFSGIGMFFTPVYRRWQFNRQKRKP